MPHAVSVIIATRNRPKDLANCLQSLVIQTRPPDQVIVIDASSDESTWQIIRSISHEGLANIQYCKAKRACLPAQRNQAIDSLKLGIAVFLDDDVVLDPSYLKVVEDYFLSHPREGIGGVQGIAENSTRHDILSIRSRLGRVLNKLIFWMFALPRTGNDQRILLSGSNMYLDSRPRNNQKVQFLQGYNMCFPVSLFQQGLRFDESYGTLGGWAYLEDVDFSYRVQNLTGRKNVVLANACLQHRKSEIARLDTSQTYKMRVVNRAYFWKEHIKSSPTAICVFVWSNIGWIVFGLRIFLRSGDSSALRGVIAGWLCLLGRRSH